MDIKHVLFCNPLRPAYSSSATATPFGGTSRRRRAGSSTGRAGGDRPRRAGLRLRQRVAPTPGPARALRPGRPAGDLRGVAGLHGRRRLLAPRALAVRRLGDGAAAAVGGPALLDRPGHRPGGRRHRRHLARLHPRGRPAGRSGRAGLPRQLLRGRRLRPLGRGRLPTEAEWEVRQPGGRCGATCSIRPCCIRRPRWRPDAGSGETPSQLFGDVWEWTASAYAPTRASARPRVRSASTTASSW